MDPRIATPESFDAMIAEPGALHVVYFWGHDCPNCENFARDLPELLAALPPRVDVIKVDAYEHTELARRFGLFGIPAFVLFRDGTKLGMMRQYYGRDYWSQVVVEHAP